MDLKKRLAKLDRLTRKADSKNSPQPEVPRDEHRVDRSLGDLGLVAADTPDGRIWIRDSCDVLPRPSCDLSELQPLFTRTIPDGCRLTDLLFLDTETTGLAGGTGTMAFLIGLSWWRDGSFNTRQVFLPDPTAECAALAAVAEMAGDFHVVVSYNGASYDLPLLRTRYLLNGMRTPFDRLTSWDLLVAVRRMWCRRLSDCRQATVEQDIGFGPDRSDDIPGARIPQTWFDFLTTGEPQALFPVVRHNHWDMVGMGAILAHLAACSEPLRTPSDSTASLPWQDIWSLARIAAIGGDAATAVRLMDAVLAALRLAPADGTAYADPRLVADAIRIYKRRRNWARLRRVIDSALAAGLDTPWLYREAAILYEHRLGDQETALDFALRTGEPGRVARIRRRLGHE